MLGLRSVTIDTVLWLGRYVGTTPEFSINLRTRHDLDVANRTSRLDIEREIGQYAKGANAVSFDTAGAA